jgi:hypothetical protein
MPIHSLKGLAKILPDASLCMHRGRFSFGRSTTLRIDYEQIIERYAIKSCTGT